MVRSRPPFLRLTRAGSSTAAKAYTHREHRGIADEAVTRDATQVATEKSAAAPLQNLAATV
jgi:hypothetical protein